MVRKILTGSLALGPLVILLHYAADIDEVAEFGLAAIALIPLAWLIGEATEHAAHHTGPGIGGFLNATFGNAPELIIALIAVEEGLTEVVRGSLTGSVVGNLLLVLGFSLWLGGTGDVDRQSSFTSLALVGLAVVLFLVPSIPGWEGDPDRDSLTVVSLVISFVLLAVYVAVTWRSLRRHHELHTSDEASLSGWSLRASLLVLGGATVVTAFVAEILVGSLEVFAEAAGLSEFFVAAVIVAIVGNAAEHGGAIVIARRGNIKLAAEIALASGAQVAVFLIPAVAIISWAIDPLSLAFRPVEIAAVAGAATLTAILLRDGRSTSRKGIVLIVAYGLVALAFLLVGDRNVWRQPTRTARARGIASIAASMSSSSTPRYVARRRTPGRSHPTSTPSDAMRSVASSVVRPSGSTSSPTKFVSTVAGSTGNPASARPSASRRARA